MIWWLAWMVFVLGVPYHVPNLEPTPGCQLRQGTAFCWAPARDVTLWGSKADATGWPHYSGSCPVGLTFQGDLVGVRFFCDE